MTTQRLAILTSGPQPAGALQPSARSPQAQTPPRVYPSVPNKPNLPRLWPKNADQRKKQSQTKPIQGPRLGPFSNLKSQISDAKGRPYALSSSAPNKPNLPGPEISLRLVYAVPYLEIQPLPGAQKQTQTKPIGAAVLIQPLALSAAPAESNGAVERIYPLDPTPSAPGFAGHLEAHPGRIRQRPLPPRGSADSMTGLFDLAACLVAGREGRTTQ